MRILCYADIYLSLFQMSDAMRHTPESLRGRPSLQEIEHSLSGDRFWVTTRNQRQLWRKTAKGRSWPSSVDVSIKLLAGNRTSRGVRRLELGRHFEQLVVAELSQTNQHRANIAHCTSANQLPITDNRIFAARRPTCQLFLVNLSRCITLAAPCSDRTEVALDCNQFPTG
jgi:hypothetical protein